MSSKHVMMYERGGLRKPRKKAVKTKKKEPKWKRELRAVWRQVKYAVIGSILVLIGLKIGEMLARLGGG